MNATVYLGFLLLAGLLTSLIAAYLICKVPASQPSSLSLVFVSAAAYVLVITLAGTAGACFFWDATSPRLSLSDVAIAGATGWVWVPFMVLLAKQDSLAAAVAAAMGAALVSSCLRRVMPSNVGTRHQNAPGSESKEKGLLFESLRSVPRDGYGFIISVCVYCGAFALQAHLTIAACVLLAVCSALLAWRLTPATENGTEPQWSMRSAAMRMVAIALAAIPFTVVAMLLGLHSKVHAGEMDGAFAGRGSQSETESQQSLRPARHSTIGISGFDSIILWPTAVRKEITPPPPTRTSPVAVGMAKPLVIHFSGSYWYFQAPNTRPGLKAHMVRGNPLAVNIHADNSVPLSMEAHQSLGSSLRLARYREILVKIENGDNRPGAMALGVRLVDSSSRGKPALYLGQQSVVTSQRGHFSIKPLPIDEVLRFPVPNHAMLRKFDEIAVIFSPDSQRAKLGARIGIEEFELIPR